MAKPAAKCIGSGYRYEFEGKRNWRSSSDERWQIEMGKIMCGRPVGTRRIDGAQVTVLKVGGKYYAAVSHAIRAKGPLGGARRRRR